MNNWDYPMGSDTPNAPWNQPDAIEIEECSVEFDGDCENPSCDHCHCTDAPECGCDCANGTCEGMTACMVAGQCLCEPEIPCRCWDDCHC